MQDEKSEKLKVKKAIEKGNQEGAKIYAQNAIRKKTEALNYMKLASRLDAVVSRLDTQAKMQMVGKVSNCFLREYTVHSLGSKRIICHCSLPAEHGCDCQVAREKH